MMRARVGARVDIRPSLQGRKGVHAAGMLSTNPIPSGRYSRAKLMSVRWFSDFLLWTARGLRCTVVGMACLSEALSGD